METRREFIKKICLILSALAFRRDANAKETVKQIITEEVKSTVYRSVNGRSFENLLKVVDLMGGIEKIIGEDDVVLIKPNVQWWNQGVPNLAALKAFVDLVMDRSGGFFGEVVIAENTHRGSSPWKHAGWQRGFDKNSDIEGINNYNDLGDHLKKNCDDRFSICHLIDVGAGNKRVFGPADGTGYVYCDGTGGVPLIEFDNGAKGNEYRAVIMTYPIIKTDKGTIIDFKNGIWSKGAYTEQALKFINFAALNHHKGRRGSGHWKKTGSRLES